MPQSGFVMPPVSETGAAYTAALGADGYFPAAPQYSLNGYGAPRAGYVPPAQTGLPLDAKGPYPTVDPQYGFTAAPERPEIPYTPPTPPAEPTSGNVAPTGPVAGGGGGASGGSAGPNVEGETFGITDAEWLAEGYGPNGTPLPSSAPRTPTPVSRPPTPTPFALMQGPANQRPTPFSMGIGGLSSRQF
jgi:hypothetical protein